MLCFKTDYLLAKTRVLESNKYYLSIHPSKPFHFIYLFSRTLKCLILITFINFNLELQFFILFAS